jgi:hypothetical protein
MKNYRAWLAIFLLWLVVPTWGIEAQDLEGTWTGSDGVTYKISINGSKVIVEQPLSGGLINKYVGTFNSEKFTLECRPQSVAHITGLPQQVSAQLFNIGYIFKGTFEFRKDSESDREEMMLTFIYDNITYDRYTFKIGPVGYDIDRTEVILNPDGYRIGDISYDLDVYEGRRGVKLSQIGRDIENILKGELTPLEREIDSLTKAVLLDGERIENLRIELDSNHRKLEAFKAQFQQLKNPSIPDELKNVYARRLEVEEQIRAQTESFIKLTGEASNEPEFKSLEKRLSDLGKERDTLDRRLKPHLPRPSPSLVSDLRAVKQDIKRLNDAIMEIRLATHDNDLSKLISLKTLHDERKLVALSLQEESKVYQTAAPKVIKVELVVGDEVRYDLSPKGVDDEALVAHFENEMEQAKSQKAVLEQELTDVRSLRKLAKEEQTAAKTQFREANEEARSAGYAVAELIGKNAEWRLGTEGIFAGIDLLMAFQDGGMVGVYAEFATKVADWATGGQKFDSFDESLLREEFFAKETQIQAWAFVTEMQAKESALQSIKESSLQVIEPKQTIAQAYRDAETIGRKEVHKAGVERWAAGEAVQRQSSELAKQTAEFQVKEAATDEATRRVLQSMKSSGGLTQEVVDAYLVRSKAERAALRAFRDLELKKLVSLDKLKAATTRLGSARAALGRTMAKIKAAPADGWVAKGKTVGENLAKNLVVKAVQASVHAYFDHEEAQAWENYFYLGLFAKKTSELQRMANNHYWHIKETELRLIETIDSLEAYRISMLKKYDDYTKATGPIVKTNKPFYAQENPVLRVTVEGPVKLEKLFLKTQKGQIEAPLTSGPTKPMPYQRVVRTFSIPMEQLKTQQSAGKVPLEFQHH